MKHDNFKIGDKVICINNYKTFVINKTYTIDDILPYHYIIDDYCFKIISMENSSNNFEEYFITLKKLRKQKLDKIKL